MSSAADGALGVVILSYGHGKEYSAAPGRVGA